MNRPPLIVAALLASAAHAGPSVEPSPVSNAAAVAHATQLQGQAQQQAQTQGQQQGQVATGGDSVSYGGGGTVKTDHDQAQAVSISSPRQVGMLYLPTVIPPSCGAAISAGHSNTRNATAGGISWTTERCWTVVIAQDFERMGAYREACELRRDVVRKQAKRARINIDCERIERDMRAAIAAAAVVPPSEPAPDYATREELRRAFEAAAGKQVK